jgi:hypothetical protein
MDKPVYVLHPGYVESRFDSQQHYICASDLAALYGLRLADCYLRSNKPIQGEKPLPAGAIHLYPRYDGNYELPGAAA